MKSGHFNIEVFAIPFEFKFIYLTNQISKLNCDII